MKDQSKFLSNFQPIIIIGMHRSGTTMITKILRELGLFVGIDLEPNLESLYFFERNISILKVCNGSYLYPDVINHLERYSKTKKEIVHLLKKDLNSFNVINFLGTKYYFKYRSIFNINFPWGWKDPRNTFTLPLWLEIFPNSKIIHVYRNGIDVASSLYTREKKILSNYLLSKNEKGNFIKRQIDIIKRYGILLFVVKKFHSFIRKLDPLYKYELFGIQPDISIEDAFRLWEKYIQKAFEHSQQRTDMFLHIKYEDFLANPDHYIKLLLEFCEISWKNSGYTKIKNMINRDRKFAFMNDRNLIKFYDVVKDSYWMKRLDYGNITSQKQSFSFMS